MDTENRNDWYKAAEKWEVDFVDKFGKQLGIIINPSKEVDKCAPDLYILKGSTVADLKVQRTPFFLSEKEYNIPPQYCWTFNVSDLFDYSVRYSDRLVILIWIKYDQDLENYGVKVAAEESIYATSLFHLKKLVLDEGKVHHYIRRGNDTNGNAYGSHTLDLRRITKIYPKNL